MKNLALVVLILAVVALLIQTLSKPKFNGELPIPKANWTSVSLGNVNPGAPNGGIIAELKNPNEVAAVVRFIQAHRNGWSNDLPQPETTAAPDSYLALSNDKQNAKLYLFLEGERVRVYFYDSNKARYYRDFHELEKTELLGLFGQKWSENHRIEAR